jgi:hypothetical protein
MLTGWFCGQFDIEHTHEIKYKSDIFLVLFMSSFVYFRERKMRMGAVSTAQMCRQVMARFKFFPGQFQQFQQFQRFGPLLNPDLLGRLFPVPFPSV